jgi:hypothetical protein
MLSLTRWLENGRLVKNTQAFHNLVFHDVKQKPLWLGKSARGRHPEREQA